MRTDAMLRVTGAALMGSLFCYLTNPLGTAQPHSRCISTGAPSEEIILVRTLEGQQDELKLSSSPAVKAVTGSTAAPRYPAAA